MLSFVVSLYHGRRSSYWHNFKFARIKPFFHPGEAGRELGWGDWAGALVLWAQLLGLPHGRLVE